MSIDFTVQEHTLKAGGSLIIHNGGNTLEILEATGTVLVRVEGGDFSELPAGLVLFNRDQRFRFCEVRNGSDANPVTFKIYIGTGDLRDNRFTASGTLNVQEVGGQSFSTVRTGIDLLRNERIAAEQKPVISTSLAAPWAFVADEYAVIDIQATGVLLTTAEIGAGIEVLWMQCVAATAGDLSRVLRDGKAIIHARAGSAPTRENFILPAGSDLTYEGAGLNGCVLVWRPKP